MKNQMNQHKYTSQIILITLIFAGLLVIQGPALVLAQETTNAEAGPDRLVTMAVEYPGIKLPVDKDIAMDILFSNQGKHGEDIDVWVESAPEGWTTSIKTYQFTVTSVHVAAGKDKNLNFKAEPPENVAPGTYEFVVNAQTRDSVFKMDQKIVVTLTEKEAEETPKESKEIQLNTAYPELRGANDASFEFSIEVKSDLDEDLVFDLAADAPKDWEVNFKPGYESKYITSLQIKANQSKNVSMEVKPPYNAQAGEYPFKMRVTAGNATAEIDLQVVLTGTYKLEAGTPDGLLSLNASPGKTANMSVYIKNTGSAPNQNIGFMSFKPENWKVEFVPEKIDVLEPGELKQVEVKITPADKALVGDYSVGVEMQGEKASKTLEFRTTVKASAAWGWIGIAIIVVVVGGLTALFRKLGRR
ncbi:hypothetical protein U27_00352 [Candidatus Vecturithrix granuli]|uniref:Alpha-galactosidase NEW3 domain-containing protein n=1 Tax=Vecturithrix granuli TaxID=1499967 RepID=A0A081C7A0_VECG1|nr:hypothetical protein U27_00352 [Candidatus Vecturithrix granuli]